MIINSPKTQQVIDQYDITLSNGQLIQVSLDLSKDTVTIDEQMLVINKAGGKMFGREFPPEELILLLRHVMLISHRQREVPVVEEEQKS